jgi:TATA-box binding protein (TBP) (component of TFIID and TFIIIB)
MLNDGNGELVRKEITVKVFQNGVFHLTGVLDARYDQDTMNKLIAVIRDNCQEAMKEPPENFDVVNRRVVLMNYTTKLTSNQTIPREALHNSIRNAHIDNIVSYYDPDVYPGVKIHIGNDKWTAKVFRTGKIILTGVTRHEDCLELIQQLLALFERVLPQRLMLLNTLNKVAQA